MKSIRSVELHFYQINTRRYCWIDRGIVQLVEQRSPKPLVVGSSPTAPAKKKAIRVSGWLFSTKSVLADGINPPLVDEIASR